jgi:D-alanine-D-alanine ligase-like ATP-grasp enzyme
MRRGEGASWAGARGEPGRVVSRRSPSSEREAGGRLAPSTRVLAGLGRLGRPGRVLSPELDALRTTGVRGALRARRADREQRDARLAAAHLATYRRIWDEAAAELGAEVSELGSGFLLISRDGAQTVVRHHLAMLNDPATSALALNKGIVHRLLAGRGVPVPEYVQAPREAPEQGLAFLQASAQPCVVKPADGTSGGTGVTCGVERADDLRRAWLRAGRWDRRVLIERQTPGAEYRLLFLDGELLDAVRRGRPCVRGDGRASVAELIEAENDRRLGAPEWEVSRLIDIDLDCELAVRGEGLTLRSVPEPGKVVTVKSTVGENAANESAASQSLAPELVAQAAQAVRLLHLDYAGIDLITPDPSRSLSDAGGTILEINATPGLHYHYQVADRDRAVAVAVPLLQRLLAGSRRS